VGAWAWTAVLGRSGVAILVTALGGEGRREGSSKAREGASTARDGAAATRRRGTSRRYGDGVRWRLLEGKGRRGATVMGCGGGSSKAREGTSAARDGATATRRRGTTRHLCAGKVICQLF